MPTLTTRTTQLDTTAASQVIENLDVFMDAGTSHSFPPGGNQDYYGAINVTHHSVIVRNCRIRLWQCNGINVWNSNNVIIEDCEFFNLVHPTGVVSPPPFWEWVGVRSSGCTNLTIRRCNFYDCGSSMYLEDAVDPRVSYVEGYRHRGPMPRGQLIQCARGSGLHLHHFYCLDPLTDSWPEDNVNVGGHPNALIEWGLIDGNNSTYGIGVILECSTDYPRGSYDSTIRNVDVVRSGNGSFATYSDNTTMHQIRSFDNHYTDWGHMEDWQQNGLPASNSMQYQLGASLSLPFTGSAKLHQITEAKLVRSVNTNYYGDSGSYCETFDITVDDTLQPMAKSSLVNNTFFWNETAPSGRVTGGGSKPVKSSHVMSY